MSEKSDDKNKEKGAGFFAQVDKIKLAAGIAGVALFLLMLVLPELSPAEDPLGVYFPLNKYGQASIGLFLLAAIWWVFEVVPIGVTSIIICVLQAFFLFDAVSNEVIEKKDVNGKPYTETVKKYAEVPKNYVPVEDPAAYGGDQALLYKYDKDKDRMLPLEDGEFENMKRDEDAVVYHRNDTEMTRTLRDGFTDFLAPSVWFIIGSLVIGMVFTKTGLTRRMAYKMIGMVGEKTSMIYLGCFVMTAALTLIMAHTAVAATIFPLLMTIYALYGNVDEVTKFGKGLFIGMSYVAGAGSIITLLGAARGAVALGFFNEIAVGTQVADPTNLEAGVRAVEPISFFGLSYYMAPVGALMVVVLWGFFMVLKKPEKASIPGLRERAKSLYASLGSITAIEVISLVIVFAAIFFLGARSMIPALKVVDKSAVILVTTILFFTFRILDIEDLEKIPWNIVFLFGGAMSIGYCLWETGAAQWIAIKWLAMFQGAHWFVFIMGIAFFVMIMTNFIMNVAAIAISLPVALVIAPYLHVSPEVVVYASLVTAGMPFLTLVGAAPNAIAYESKQFSAGEYFVLGIPASVILMVVLGLFILLIWPIMGMPTFIGGG